MVNINLSAAEGSNVTLDLVAANQPPGISSKKTTSSVATILNLPVELKQNIALRLNAKDYASLRESCLIVSQEVDSFHLLHNKIKSGNCASQYEKNVKDILLNQVLRSFLFGQEGEDFINIIHGVQIKPSPVGVNCFCISTGFHTHDERYSPITKADKLYPFWVEKAFMLFKQAIDTPANESTIIAVQRRTYISTLFTVGVKFSNDFFSRSQIASIFMSLNHFFCEAKSKEKILIAIIARELEIFFLKNIPYRLERKDINNITGGFSDMLTIANKIRHLLREANG